MKLEQFSLTQDPFPIVPDGPVHRWAGHKDLKLELEDIVKGVRARDIGITELVVVYGELGAGKSHALRYLKTLISEDTENFDSLAIYVERPRVSSKVNFLELQRYIIKTIGRERIKGFCVSIKAEMDALVDEIAKAAGHGGVQNKSSFYDSACERFPADDRQMLRLLVRSATSDGLFDFLMGTERCNGDEYEGKIDSDFIAAKVLSDFFRVLTLEIHNERRVQESIYLFIDECEVLTETKTSESDLVFSGFRELINGLPYRFCLMLSFSAATALIEAIMPQHLLKRMTRGYIEIPTLDDNQAVSFLIEQLNNFRPEGSEYLANQNPYPFTAEALQYIVQNTTTMTPRSLFIDCKRVLERAIRRYDLQPGQEITRDLAERILSNVR